MKFARCLNDGILDIWDGYNYGSQFNSGTNCSEQFVPIMIEIPASINLASATFQFDFWSGSLATGTPGREPQQFGNGNIRIWMKDGNLPRNGNDIKQYGNIVSDGAIYTAEQLGFADTNGTLLTNTITLYVEGHSLGSNVITIGMDCVSNGQNVHVEDTVKYEVQESHWVVQRAGEATAIGVSGQGDTILNLAVDIGLQPDEFKQWLTVNTQTLRLEDNTEVAVNQLTIGSKLAGGQVVRVPNTIYMAWFGECGTTGQWWMSFNQNKTELEKLGFSVFVFNNDNYDYYDYSYGENDLEYNPTCFDFTFDLLEQSSFKSLQGLYMMGHGSPNSVGSRGTNFSTSGPIWDIGYVDGTGTTTGKAIKDYLTYKLGALIIHACYGDNVNARSLVSTNGGIFFGINGIYYPIPGYDDFDPIAKFWGYDVTTIGQVILETFGGKQKTNTFSSTTF